MPELLVVVVETSPVLPEFLKAMLVHVFNAMKPQVVSKSSLILPAFFSRAEVLVAVPRTCIQRNV